MGTTAQSRIATVNADQVTAGDLLVGYGPVTRVQQGGGDVDITYRLPGTGAGLGTLSCRADAQVKVRR